MATFTCHINAFRMCWRCADDRSSGDDIHVHSAQHSFFLSTLFASFVAIVDTVAVATATATAAAVVVSAPMHFTLLDLKVQMNGKYMKHTLSPILCPLEISYMPCLSHGNLIIYNFASTVYIHQEPKVEKVKKNYMTAINFIFVNK